MNITVEVRGISLFHGDDGRAPFRNLAFGDLYLPDLQAHLKGIKLIWHPDRGYETRVSGLRPGQDPVITWKHKGVLGRAVAAALAGAYVRMTGDDPEAQTPKQANALAAARRFAEKGRRAEPEPNAPDADRAGLGRYLGLEAGDAEAA